MRYRLNHSWLAFLGEKLEHRFHRGSFARNVFVLFIGTTAAQAVSILVSPVLTRLYSPEAFGVYAVFLAATTIAGNIAAGKYEAAIILPEADEDGFSLMALACLIAFAASAAAMLFVIACKAPIARWFNTEQSSSWLYYVPLMILLSGCYGALNYWNNRRKNFARLSANRVLKSVVSSGANVGLGFAGAGSSGLIHGSVLGQACTTGLFGFQAWREEKSLRAALTFGAMRRQAIRYRDFPKYLVASGLVEAGAGQVPIILFSSLFGAAALGYFSLAMRLVSLPMGLIAESIRDVFRQTASEHFASYGTCRPVFMQTCRRLLLLSVLPFSIILLFGPFLFAFVFGDQWRPSGAHAQIMVPMLFLRFVSSPLSSTFYIAEKQKWDFALQGIFFAAIVAALAVVSFYTRKPAAAVITYTSVYSLKYIIEFFLSYRFSLGSTHRVRA